MAEIVTHTKEQHANALAAYMPGGRLFDAAKRNDATLRKFLIGLGCELLRSEQFLRSFEQELNINTTELFIDEWEAALGIPDDCFLGPNNIDGIDGRRRDVLVKLASLGVQTVADFEALADIFGVDVEITSGSDFDLFFPAPFPIIFIGSVEDGKFVVIVKFLTPSPLTDLVECLFNKLIPANCVLAVLPN